MRRKKVKKDRASTSCNSSTKDQSIASESFHSDTSLLIVDENPHFKILLSEFIEEKSKYSSFAKNWDKKNVAFVHPSVLQALDCTNFILMQGKMIVSLFQAFPLKSVKKSTVVLLDGMGFMHEECVTLHSYEGNGYEAEEIGVVCKPNIEIDESMKNILLRRLGSKFIWPGLKHQLKCFDVVYEFTITKVQSTGQILLQNSLKTDKKNLTYSRNLNDTSGSFSCDLSLNTSTENRELPSKFASLRISDDGDLNDSQTESAKTIQSMIPNFFVLSHCSSIVFDKENIDDDKNNFPLFENIGGFKMQIQSIKSFIDSFHKITEEKVQSSCRFLLLKGPDGIGKTMILNSICNECKMNYIEKINILPLCFKSISEALIEIEQKFKNAAKRSPSFLLLENFFFLESEKVEFSSSILNKLFDLIKSCKTKVLVLASSTSDSSFISNLFDSSISKEIHFALPSIFERIEIFKKILLQRKHQLSDEQIKLCAELSQGMGGGQIFKLIKYDATILSKIRVKNMSSAPLDAEDIELIFCDIKTALKKKKSLIKANTLHIKKVRWSDIGGMDSVKDKLKEEIELSKISSEILEKFNYSPPRGILLYGPPGCSKTMIAKALATECNWDFISKKSSDILNCYVGESEKALKNLFVEARIKSPCIIFLDEIDGLASERSSSSSASGVGNRIVNTLLTEMAGIETLNDVMVIAATNRPDIVDPALLRRGRIGHHIYVPLPDSKARKEIFKISMKRRQMAEEIDFDYLVKKTEGYSGAEIVQLCNEAAMQVLLESPKGYSSIFYPRHFEKALHTVKPRTTKETIQFYEQFSLK